MTCALKSFAKDVRALRDQQRKERQQKREVDKLARRLGRRILCKKQTERNRYGSRRRIFILVRRRRVIAVNGFQMRPSKVFSSMVELFDSMAELFSEAATKMQAGLVRKRTTYERIRIMCTCLNHLRYNNGQSPRLSDQPDYLRYTTRSLLILLSANTVQVFIPKLDNTNIFCILHLWNRLVHRT
ncbi:hypothetical protein COP2_017927 [Malus domestica]